MKVDEKECQMMRLTTKALHCGVAAAFFVFSVAVAPAAEAKIQLTPWQEQQVGRGQINSSGAAYLDFSPELNLIHESLMKWNKDRLVPYKNDNIRGLRSPHLLITNRSKVNAYSLPGGHIFVSDALVIAFLSKEFDPNTGIPTGEQKERQFGNGYEVYGHSAIAAALAHEYSHWERNFLQQETDTIVSHISDSQERDLKTKLQAGDGRGYNAKLDELGFSDRLFPAVKKFMYDEELKADRGAMEYLDNTDIYSPGSLMMVVSRMRDPKPTAGKKIDHPSAKVRKQQVIEHIKKLSHGRVQIDEQGRMMLDGKLFVGNGYMPARSDVSQYDRTTYVAGQLAKSVHYKAKRIVPMDDAHSISKSHNMVPIMAVCETDNSRRYVIDKFAISAYEAQALAAGKNKGSSAENKAARELVRFLTR